MPLQKEKQKRYGDMCEEIARTHQLSQRESEALFYLGKGYSSSNISEVLYISVSTVRTHVQNIYRKIPITSRIEVIGIFENLSAEGSE